jgi:hypothetical protein
MCKNMKDQAHENNSVDILRAYKCFALDGITSFCFGTSMNATAARHFAAPIIEAMDASMPIVPLLRHFPMIKNGTEVLPADLISTLQPQMAGLMELREASVY